MAWPYDMELGHVGHYDLDAARDEHGQQNPNLPPKSCSDTVKEHCDRFRVAFAQAYCGRALRIPSLLLLGAYLIFMGFIIAIPLFFATSLTEDDHHTNFRNVDGERWSGNKKPVEFNIEPMKTFDVDECQGWGFVCTAYPQLVISTKQRCDGHADCPDGSDERDCHECKTAFSCPYEDDDTSPKLCLRGSDLCDGKVHCFDRSDESAFCTPHCDADQYQCPDEKMCLPKSYLCDGDAHCRSEADEKDCNGTCNNGAKWCSATQACIPKWKLCDGVNDCPDIYDEIGCDCELCSGTSRALCKRGGVCIGQKHLCDGTPDCPGGGDEEHCPVKERTPSINGYKMATLKGYEVFGTALLRSTMFETRPWQVGILVAILACLAVIYRMGTFMYTYGLNFGSSFTFPMLIVSDTLFIATGVAIGITELEDRDSVPKKCAHALLAVTWTVSSAEMYPDKYYVHAILLTYSIIFAILLDKTSEIISLCYPRFVSSLKVSASEPELHQD